MAFGGIILKKLFHVIIFFAIVAGIFYFTTNMEINKNITLNKKNKFGNIEAKESTQKETLKDLKIKDISKLSKDAQRNLMEYIDKSDLIKKDKLNAFVNTGKNLKGYSKDMYDKILYSSYSREPKRFIKEISKLDTKDIKYTFNSIKSKYVDKNKFIESIKKEINSGEFTKKEKDKIQKIINEFKSEN